jgi:hypothetical protein
MPGSADLLRLNRGWCLVEEDAIGAESVRVRNLAPAWGDHNAVDTHTQNSVLPGMDVFLSPPVV